MRLASKARSQRTGGVRDGPVLVALLDDALAGASDLFLNADVRSKDSVYSALLFPSSHTVLAPNRLHQYQARGCSPSRIELVGGVDRGRVVALARWTRAIGFKISNMQSRFRHLRVFILPFQLSEKCSAAPQWRTRSAYQPPHLDLRVRRSSEARSGGAGFREH